MRTSSVASRFLAVTLALAPALWLGACAPSARQRPVEGGPVDTGAGSLEATRRQLEGTWTLTKFEVLNQSGQLTVVRAKAQLTYDAFGNLTMKGVLEEPLPGETTVTGAPALVYSGRAVIDTARQELQLMGIESSIKPDPSIQAAIAVSARRKYAFEGNQLTISVVDAQGRTTSRATYTKS
jgi:hypothetical protein